MPEYSVLLAYSVRVYGTTEIEADSPEQAAEKIRAAWESGSDQPDDVIWEAVHDVDYSTASEPSIVSMDEGETTVVDGIELTPQDKPWATISAETLKAKMKACA